MTPFRIGVNALYLIPGNVGGTETYLRSLLQALRAIDKINTYYVFVNRETGADPDLIAPNFHVVRCRVQARHRPLRILYEQLVLPLLLARRRIDVVFNPGFTMPALSQVPSVTVFHDLQHKRHPEFFRRLDLPFWTFLLWLAAARSRSLIAVSPSTAEDITRYYPSRAKKTIVVPHGVDQHLFEIGLRRRPHGRSREPYILAVATLHPHKNLERLLEVFRQFRAFHPQYRLVVAGLKGFDTDLLEQRRMALGLIGCVEFTGWIPRQKLYRLYDGADVFIAPSLFEGFGMPLLEALAAGIPTACSDIPVFRWVAGATVEFFDPKSESGMLQALERAATDTGSRLRAASDGPPQARKFDWTAAAGKTLDELTRVARNR